MKRSSLLIVLVLTATALLAQTPPPITTVNLSPSSPQLTAVDPYSNAVSSSDGLKPARPFWYAVDNGGLTILRIGDNKVVYRVPWPATIQVALPEGDGPDFMTAPAPPSGWEPVAMTVSYPTEESLASTSETPATYVFVVMARSGYEWQSNPNPPPGRDPNVRDTLVPTTNPLNESSMLVEVDVTDPTYPVATYPTGPAVVGAILGHGAGQPAFDPATGNIYIGNMPSRSLPTGSIDLSSFVSVVMPIAMAETAAAAEPVTGPPDPPLVLCGPEHPDEGLLAGEPYVWPCMAEGGEGELVWEFVGLPSWVTPHHDKITGELDGVLYGTPPADGVYTFQVRVTDMGDDPLNPEPNSSDWTTVTLNVTPTGVAAEAEAGFEVGVAGGQGIGGTGSCAPASSSSVLGVPGLILPENWQPSPLSMVPNWIDVQTAYVNGVVKGCYVMGTAPISGEYYEFALPNFKFTYPFDREAVIFSGNVAGTYTFDPLPAGVSLAGLAWHQIEKIHDPSTEADILNGEFIGVEPLTGQLYRILLPQSVPEGSGGEATVTAPETRVEMDEITPEGQPLLASLQQLRSDIAAQLTQPNRAVAFGNLAVEADRDIFVTAPWILDPDNSSFIPIGGPTPSPIEKGVLIKANGGNVSTIDPQGVQAYSVSLNSDLRPAIPGSEPGQKDNGVLWVTGTNTGNVAVVDTASGQVPQVLPVPNATSLGGISVDTGTAVAYAAIPSLQSVSIFGNAYLPRAPEIWLGVEPAVTFEVGIPGSFTVLATGTPTPKMSYSGALPTGVSFTDNGDGTATFAGTAAVGTGGDYTVTVTASNGILPNSAESFILTVPLPPSITSANTTTFTVGMAGSFTVISTGAPGPVALSYTGTLPNGVTFADNEDSTAALAGTPAAGTQGTYVFSILASTGFPPDAIQEFTLIVNPGSGGTNVAPAITSPSTTSFTVGQAGAFQFTTSGSPAATLTEAGALPNGIIFVDNTNGTAVLAGVPAAGSQGNYPLTITAANGIQPNAIQSFTLVVNAGSQAVPVITSAGATTFTAGSAGSFVVTATGSPAPTLTHWGTLPSGVTFTDNGNSSATLSGTSASGSQGSYPFTITAANTAGSVTQNFLLTVNPEPTKAPVVTAHPISQTVNVGQAATFSASASGTPTPTIQWQQSTNGTTWSNLAGGTSTSYTTPAATAAMSGYRYRAVFSNSAGTVYTTAAVLTVNGPPVITAHPANQTVTAGHTATFTASGSGSPTPTVQWQLSTNGGSIWSDIGGATSASYTTPATTTAMNGYRYRAMFTNSVGTANSNAAILTVNPPDVVPSVTAHPASQTVTAGQRATFSAAANGSPTPTVQWQLSINSGLIWSNITGATSTSYATPTTTTAMNGYQYRAVFTNRAGTATSNVATLTVNAQIPALAILTTSLPAGAVSRSYSYQLQAQGGTAPYTWSVGTGLPTGVTVSSTGFISGTPSAQGNYRFTVQVTDSAAHSASRTLTLRIARR